MTILHYTKHLAGNYEEKNAMYTVTVKSSATNVENYGKIVTNYTSESSDKWILYYQDSNNVYLRSEKGADFPGGFCRYRSELPAFRTAACEASNCAETGRRESIQFPEPQEWESARTAEESPHSAWEWLPGRQPAW